MIYFKQREVIMDDQEINDLKKAKRDLQNIYELCENNIGTTINDTISRVFREIKERVPPAKKKVSIALQKHGYY